MLESQKILKLNKVSIIADYREKEIVENLKKLGAFVTEVNLQVADFVCSDGKVGIERKSHSDFISSIIDGRLFRQAKALKENFKIPIIIVEGSSNRRINENALIGALASLVTNFGVNLLTTKNPLETSKLIYWIAKKEQEEKDKFLGFRIRKKVKSDEELKELIVSSLPKINRKLARRLLKHFGSVENVFKANEFQLKKVKGIGDKLAKKIRKLISEKYKGIS